MAKTFTAPFAQTPKTGHAVATTAIALTGANALEDDDPASTVLLCTAGADGAIVSRITAMPRATVAATGLYLFLRKTGDAAGTRKLIDSELMAAHTMAAATRVVTTPFVQYSETTPLRLEALDELYVGIGVALAAGILFRAEFTNF